MDGFVPLVHNITGGVMQCPDNPTALADAADRGWHPVPDPETAVPDGPVGDVLDWVGDDPSRATTALAAETAPDGKNRTSLISKLEATAAGATSDNEEADRG